MRRASGFTLIELLVTMALAGIMATFALNLFSSGHKLFLNYRRLDEKYFEYGVQRALAARMIDENPGVCNADGFYSFSGSDADSLQEHFPFPEIHCRPARINGFVVYYRGLADSIARYPVGWTHLTGR